MAEALTTSQIEQRLAASLKKDRATRSRRKGTTDDGTIICQPSNRSVGLAIAIEQRTGEDYDHVMTRMDTEYS